MKISLILVIAMFSILQACTWVKPTAAGDKVVVAESFNVKQCEKLSTITTSVKSNVGSMNRKPQKVTQELITLARNEAAIRGGDSIVSKGPAKDGAMTFDVYRCAG